MSLANLIKRGGLRGLATAIVASVATVDLLNGSCVAKVAGVAVAKAPDTAANYPAPDSDRWCWPHSSAMNGAEIETFSARLTRFTDKGLRLDDADDLVDKLVRRDRDLDDRRLCLECIHLAGQSGAAWHCKNWQRAGVALRARDAQLATALVLQLQRCEGFRIHV